MDIGFSVNAVVQANQARPRGLSWLTMSAASPMAKRRVRSPSPSPSPIMPPTTAGDGAQRGGSGT